MSYISTLFNTISVRLVPLCISTLIGFGTIKCSINFTDLQYCIARLLVSSMYDSQHSFVYVACISKRGVGLYVDNEISMYCIC